MLNRLPGRRPAGMRGRSLVLAGLCAQVIGVSTQGVWHVLLAGRSTGLLTEDRTFLIDHTISNLGVAGMVIGAAHLYRARPATTTRAVVVGTALEVLGAAGDMLGHFRGGESPVAFAFIGTGFLVAAAGVATDMRQRRSPRGPRDSSQVKV